MAPLALAVTFVLETSNFSFELLTKVSATFDKILIKSCEAEHGRDSPVLDIRHVLRKKNIYSRRPLIGIKGVFVFLKGKYI